MSNGAMRPRGNTVPSYGFKIRKLPGPPLPAWSFWTAAASNPKAFVGVHSSMATGPVGSGTAASEIGELPPDAVVPAMLKTPPPMPWSPPGPNIPADPPPAPDGDPPEEAPWLVSG